MINQGIQVDEIHYAVKNYDGQRYLTQENDPNKMH